MPAEAVNNPDVVSRQEEKETEDDESDKRADPMVVAEDQHVDELDSEGFLDLTGSGRLRKKVLEEGRSEEGRPQRGMVAKCKVTGNMISGPNV